MTSKVKTKSGSSSRDGVRKPQIGAKEAISTFCKLLHHHCALQLSPEVLRQAKFDRHEAVLPMWNLLWHLTDFSLQEKFPKLGTSPVTTNPEETIDNIKQIMWYQGYRCAEFFDLPSNMDKGSQELLLASGWLIAKTGLLQRLIESNQVPFLGGDTAYLHEQDMHSEKYRISKRQCQTISKTLSPSGKVKCLAWIAGRCKMAMRGLHMKQQELCNLTHQIHQATQGVSISSNLQHLSALETFLLRYPRQMHKYQDMLHAEVLRLQTCVKWKEQEHVFWQWMESVLDAKLSKTPEEIQPESVSSDTFTPTCTSNLAMETSTKVQKVFKELGDVISQIQGYLKDLPDDQYDLISEDMELIKRDIISDAEKKISSLKPPTGCRHLKKQPTRLHYIPLSNKGAKINNNNNNAMQIETLSMRDEIDRLESVVCDLEQQHKQMRDKLRDEMDMISGRLNGVVCIPPMGKPKY